jgi:hypothetical protein
MKEYRIQNIAAGVTSYLVNHMCKDLDYFKKVYYLYTNTYECVYLHTHMCVCMSNEWIKKMWYLYTMEFYLATKKNEILSY